MSMPREVLRNAVHLYARNWRVLLPMTALLMLPLLVVQSASVGLHELVVPGSPAAKLGTAGKTVMLVVDILVRAITGAIVILAVATRLGGRPIAVRTTWRKGLGRIRPVLTAALASLLPAAGWSILLILPPAILAAFFDDRGRSLGISLGLSLPVGFLAVRLAFVTCVAMLEGLGGFSAYRRNLDLARGHFWSLAPILSTLAVFELLLALLANHVLPEAVAVAFHTALGGLLLPLEAALVTLFYRRLRSPTDEPLAA